MFKRLNEFRYTAKTGRIYTIYFLQFWADGKKKGDYIVKYQIRAPDKDFVWYGRMSRERFIAETGLSSKDIKSMPKADWEGRIEEHLRSLLLYVMKRGLDKGYEEPNTEFVFYKKPPIIRRAWEE